MYNLNHFMRQNSFYDTIVNVSTLYLQSYYINIEKQSLLINHGFVTSYRIFIDIVYRRMIGCMLYIVKATWASHFLALIFL